jgi:hypothetical protein
MKRFAIIVAAALCAPTPTFSAEGTVQGKFVINGKSIPLTHVYAIARPDTFHKEKEEIRVILSDAPIGEDALRHAPDQLPKLAATGKLHAVAVTIGDDMFGHGKSANGTEIYTVEINKGWMSTGGLDRFEQKSLDAKTIAGHLQTKSPHTFDDYRATFAYDATFNSPIER